MFAVLLIAALAVAGIAGSIVTVAHDGYRPAAVRRPDDRIRSV